MEVCFGDVDGVEAGSVVVEDPEEVVVVADEVGGRGGGFRDLCCGLHGACVGHGAEEAVICLR